MILCWCCQVTLISASGRLVKLLHKPVSQRSVPRNQTKVEGEPTLPSEFLHLCLLSLSFPPSWPPSKNKRNFLGHFSSKQLARSAFSLKMPCLVQWLCWSALGDSIDDVVVLIRLLSLPGPIGNLKLGCMVMIRKFLVGNQVRVFKVIDILDYLKFKII